MLWVSTQKRLDGLIWNSTALWPTFQRLFLSFQILKELKICDFTAVFLKKNLPDFKMLLVCYESVLRNDWMDSFEILQHYDQHFGNFFYYFRFWKNWKLATLRPFFWIFFAWFFWRYVLSQYSEMGWWIHLKSCISVTNILEKIYAFSDFKRIENWWFYSSFFWWFCAQIQDTTNM